MELTGQRFIPRPQQIVWDALNDPEVLAQSIPGCEKLERTGPDEFQMEMLAAVGPVRAKFKARLTMSDVVAPRSYVLSFTGNGGAAGFGNGASRVQLEPQDGGTLLHYEAKAQVGGKIAQVGARLVQGVTEKLAEQFFTRFVAEVEARSPAPAHGEPPAPASGPGLGVEATQGLVPTDPPPSWHQSTSVRAAALAALLTVVALWLTNS